LSKAYDKIDHNQAVSDYRIAQLEDNLAKKGKIFNNLIHRFIYSRITE